MTNKFDKMIDDLEGADLEAADEVEEGHRVVPSIDPERYTDLSHEGLEGPFRLASGKVVYYDPVEGRYYDRDSDMYLSHEEYDQHSKYSVEQAFEDLSKEFRRK